MKLVTCFILAFTFGIVQGAEYFESAAKVGANADLISRQQKEMHRFVVDYWKGPVGVNDLGWVSFDDPYFVLDLWGLGSSDALHERLAHPTDSNWTDAMCKAHGIKLCMIYSGWFPHPLPQDWTYVGSLIRYKNAPSQNVDFYATDPAYAGEARQDLREFGNSLNGHGFVQLNGG